jgi:hypothetical protein
MVTPRSISDEETPEDGVVVMRGGLHSLATDKVRELCEDSLADSGFYGLSVFASLDSDVPGLCRSVPRLRTRGTVWVATCGELRQRGFGLLATDARPHFDIVLADVAPGTIESLVSCFTSMPNSAKQR